MGVHMAHMGHPQKAVIGGIGGGGHAQTNAQRDARAMLAPIAQPGGVRGTKTGSGDRSAAVHRIRHIQPNRRIAHCPGVKCRPNRAGQHIMPRPDGGQAFFGDHVQRLAQSIKMVRRRGACPVLPKLGGVGAWPPIPIGRAQIGGFGGRNGFVGKPQKPHAGRRHQALLAGRHRHINTPGIHMVFIATKAGDAIHRQQRRMPRRIDCRAQAYDIRPDCRCGIHLRHQHRFDRMVAVGAQGLLDQVQIKRRRLAEIQQLHLDTHAARRIGPAKAELPRCQHQSTVAARKQVGIRRLPCRMSIPDKGGDVLCGARHAAQIGPQRFDQFVQPALIDVGRGTVHRGQHPVGHHRRAGNGKIRSAMGKGHRGLHL